ncbi:Hypothetical predicted protein, partial [Paramuricea clavata]
MNRLVIAGSQWPAGQLWQVGRLYSLMRPSVCQRTFSDEAVRIGNVRIPLKTPKHVEKVPLKYYTGTGSNNSESILQHLKWIMQK